MPENVEINCCCCCWYYLWFLLEITPGWAGSSGIAGVRNLQDGCPACHQTDSIKTLDHGSHSFTDKKIQDFSRTTMKNFPGSFRSPRMFKYKEKNGIYLQYSKSVVHCRKFSMKQNVLHYCHLFSIWTTRKMHDFQGYFSRTLSFNF